MRGVATYDLGDPNVHPRPHYVEFGCLKSGERCCLMSFEMERATSPAQLGLSPSPAPSSGFGDRRSPRTACDSSEVSRQRKHHPIRVAFANCEESHIGKSPHRILASSLAS
jgi:hypothetical protein